MHDIQIDDYFTVRGIGSCQASPDGRRVLYALSEWDLAEKQRLSTWWVIDPTSGASQRLTEQRFAVRSPRWAKDSQSIYFLHQPDAEHRDAGDQHAGVRQVWQLDVVDGEPRRVTASEHEIGSFDLADDPVAGACLFYTVQQQKNSRITTVVYRFDTREKKTSRVYEWDGVAKDFAVSPNGRYVAVVTAPDDTLLMNEGWSRLFVYDTQTGERHEITPEGWRAEHPSPYGWFDTVCWSGDSDALAFGVGFDGLPPILYLAEFDQATPELATIDRPSAIYPKATTMQWRPGSRDLLFLAQEKGHQRLYRMSQLRGGEYESLDVLTPDDVVIDAFSSAGPDDVAIIKCTTTQPENLYLLNPAGDTKPLTDINPHIDTWKLPSISLVQWQSEDGRTIQGVLELPPGYNLQSKPDKPLAMVVVLHGGPTSANLERLRFRRGQGLLAAKGYAVFCPNFRGSTGYGDGFIHELIGNTNDIEVKDVLTGVEAMIQRGIADPDRVGVMGWSYGGYLTNCLISRGTQFKAASTGAGIVDMHLQWGLMDTPGWVVNILGGDQPWEDPAGYRKASPIEQMNQATAATLIHVGAKDPRCPPANARVLYRALTHFGEVDAELLIYPGEGHGLRQYDHLRAKMQWEHAWFDRHLRGVDSPLPGREGLER